MAGQARQSRFPRLKRFHASHHRRKMNWSRWIAEFEKSEFVTVDTEFIRETTYLAGALPDPDGGARRHRAHRPAVARHRPDAVLRADGQRDGDQGLPRRAPGHRDHLPSRRPDPASGLRYAGRGDGLRLRRQRLLRPAGAEDHRCPPRQVVALHRLAAPAAVGQAARICAGRRHPSDRRLPPSRRPSWSARTAPTG